MVFILYWESIINVSCLINNIARRTKWYTTFNHLGLNQYEVDYKTNVHAILDKEKPTKPQPYSKNCKQRLGKAVFPRKEHSSLFVQYLVDSLKTNMQETLYEFSQVYLGIFMYIHVHISMR